MSLLSSSVSINRYHVEGKINDSILEVVREGLIKYSFKEFEEESSEKIIGWTSFNNHFNPDFTGSSFIIDDAFVFSLRIDKKSLSSKITRKFYHLEMAKQLEKSGRDYLTANEKKQIKEHVLNVLYLRIPATPSIFDVVWHFEKSVLWFFSSNKAANEELEILFQTSFKHRLIKIFPFFKADLLLGLKESERDKLSGLSPSVFME
ncbi:MAG: recombination-associated protein RdgC [Proteobacteria bacterium]|nr:recombination-associated protein RdgC [Pseudomonadota bacterium]